MSVERVRGLSPEDRSPSGAARAAIGGAEAVLRREVHAGRRERFGDLLPRFIYAVLAPLVGQREALREAAGAARLLEANE
jgi:hypothetical protein